MLHGDISDRLTGGGDPGEVTDAGGTTTATATVLTAGETGVASDPGSLTAAAATHLTAPTTGIATDSGGVATAAAAPETASTTGIATDAGGTTGAAASVMTASDSVVGGGPTVVEDFESGDLSAYTTPGTGAFSVINATTFGGDWYLEAASTDSNGDELLLSTTREFDGPGTLTARTRGNANASGSIIVAVDTESAASLTGVECQWDAGDLYLGEWDNGSWSQISTSSGTDPPTETELTWRIDWDASDEFTLTLSSADESTQYATTSGTPTISLAGTGIGFNAFHGRQDWDDLEVA